VTLWCFFATHILLPSESSTTDAVSRSRCFCSQLLGGRRAYSSAATTEARVQVIFTAQRFATAQGSERVKTCSVCTGGAFSFHLNANRLNGRFLRGTSPTCYALCDAERFPLIAIERCVQRALFVASLSKASRSAQGQCVCSRLSHSLKLLLLLVVNARLSQRCGVRLWRLCVRLWVNKALTGVGGGLLFRAISAWKSWRWASGILRPAIASCTATSSTYMSSQWNRSIITSQPTTRASTSISERTEWLWRLFV